MYNQCRVNALSATQKWQHKMGRATTERCLTCGAIDDVKHAVLECKRTESMRTQEREELINSNEEEIANDIILADFHKDPERIIKVLKLTDWMYQ